MRADQASRAFPGPVAANIIHASQAKGGGLRPTSCRGLVLRGAPAAVPAESVPVGKARALRRRRRRGRGHAGEEVGEARAPPAPLPKPRRLRPGPKPTVRSGRLGGPDGDCEHATSTQRLYPSRRALIGGKVLVLGRAAVPFPGSIGRALLGHPARAPTSHQVRPAPRRADVSLMSR